MAKPARDSDYQESETPVIRPDLRVLEGGSEIATKHPENDDSENPIAEKSLSSSPEELKDAEESGKVGPSSTEAEDEELSSTKLGGGEDATAEASQNEADKSITNFNFNNKGGLRNQGLSKGKGVLRSKAVMIGGPIILLFVILAMFLTLFVGSLKSVHFATVLRSTGFASTQLVMRNAFSEIAYDSAVLTPGNIGHVDAAGRTMLDRIRGINPDKVMKDLGRNGDFSVNTAKGEPSGFTVNDKSYSLDEFSQDAFPGKNYGDLSAREKFTVKNHILDKVDTELADVFEAESHSFRSSFFKGFRSAFDINTYKWAVKAREFFGKKPSEAYELNREYNVEDINEGGISSSSLDEVKQASQGIDDAVQADVKGNLNQRVSDWTSAGLEKVGISQSQFSELSDTAGKVSIGVFAMTMYCTARDLDQSLMTINKNKEAAANRYAHEVQTASDEIKSGDAPSPAVEAENATWDGYNGAPDAAASPFYLEATGRDPNSAPTSAMQDIPTATVAANPVHKIYSLVDDVLGGFLSPIPGVGSLRNYVVGSVCSVALNPVAQATVAATDIVISVAGAALTGGLAGAIRESVQSAITVGVGLYGANKLGDWIQQLVKDWSGTDFSGAATGVDRYNAGAVATDYTNSTTARGDAFGKPMKTTESQNTKRVALAATRDDYSNQSAAQRYFAIDNPYSLIGLASAHVPATTAAATADVSSMLQSAGTGLADLLSGKVFGSLFSNFGFSQKAAAASSTSFEASHNFFGVGQWGWTTTELNTINTDPAFETLANASWVSKNVSQSESDKYMACYKPPKTTDVPDYCTEDYLSSTEALHWRLYQLHSSVISQLDGSDDNVNINAPSSTSTAPSSNPIVKGDTSNQTCQAGTDAGVGLGYQDGQPYNIRLCKVQGITVNSQISGNLDKLLNASKAAGIPLSGYGFRTMQGQIDARKKNGCPDIYNSPSSSCSVPTARPGFSDHQMGLAVDFGYNGQTICFPRASSSCTGNIAFNWLKQNAATYGLKNLPSESWHWSVDGK